MAVTEFEKAVEARVQARKEEQSKASLALLDNEAFMDTQAHIMALSQEVQKLDTIIHQLNTGITPFVSKDGTKFSVRVFPIASFGMGLDKLMGIVSNSSSAFTDEMALQYEAIVGIQFTELSVARELLGTVDYVNKDGIYVEGTRTVAKNEVRASVDSDEVLAGTKAVKQWETENIGKLYLVVQSICVKLGLYEILPNVEAFTEAIARWEQAATRRATKQLEEIEKSATLNSDSSFTIED